MKKCASCSKDLPDAALHCVFCGAKQAPAPVSSTAANAKTVMGNYSASDMIAALKAGGNLPSAPAIAPPPAAPVVGNPPVQPPRNASGPTPAPYAPPQAVQSPYAPAQARPAPAPPPPAVPMNRPPAPASSPPAYSAPSSGPPSMPPPLAHGVPMADAAAKTVMAQAPVSPPSPAVAATIVQGPTGQGPGPSTWQPPAPSPPPAPASSTAPSTPSTPPTPEPEAVAPPYLASQTAARAGRPVEPWRQPLRMVMFIFGILAIAYMAIPKSLDPLQFALFGIVENEGTAKIEPILVGAIGVFGLIFSFMPMPTTPRGLLAGVLGLAYAIVPTILKGLDTWQALALPGAMIFLIPGLVIRSEYKDSILPRILVTLGALGLLATLLVPVNDNLPLIGLVEAVIDGDLEHKIPALLGLLVAVMAVLSLLVWLPAPSGGGAKVFAWFFILFPLFEHIYTVLYTEDVVNLITATPAQIFVGWTPDTAAFAFLGYGMATVLGKSLE